MQEKDYLDYKDLFIKKRKIFLNAVENYTQEQQNVFTEIINANVNTKYGKKYNFENIKTIKDFQNQIPISKYEDYDEYIKEILYGKQNILTTEKVLLLEPTGGSTSGSKYIPYTESLKKAFNKGLEPWLSDLFLNYPEIIKNPMYWSITPAIKQENTKSQVPIGFDNDLAYLYSPFSDILSKQIIIPNIKDSSTEEFYDITIKELKKHKNLAFVSVWNPTLFLNIIKKEKFTQKNWKNLKIISCWDESNAKTHAEKLKKQFKQTYIQGKGLLATEGIMTIPIEGIGKIPCIQSHFYEFIDIQTGDIKLLGELELEKEYSILLTTQGGLYRYRIGDIVKVYSKYKNCPLLSFIGRENNISDFFGEKLNEQFIKEIISKLKINQKATFYMFTPYCNKDEFYYNMYYEGKADIKQLSLLFENELNKNYHYKYARDLNQLEHFRIKKVKNGHKQYLENCIKHGQKLGDIKPIIFSKNLHWYFEIEEER